MAENEIPTIAGIFWQKNYDGMRDAQDIVVQAASVLDTDTTTQALEQKYGDSVKSIETSQK